MADRNQHTLARGIALKGIGVHTGETATLTIRPAPPDAGIVFVRTDLPGAPPIPANLDHVTATELGTGLGAGGAEVLTVEHVLAALAALEVDNATLELGGPEVPILDGSFAPFMSAIQDAGRQSQNAEAEVVEVAETISVNDQNGGSYVALPDHGFRISATIEFEHPAIGRQHAGFVIDAARFGSDLARARTFGFHDDAAKLRARGLALGSSLANTIVLDGSGVMNDGLRYPDEFLRHKVGDIVGDLALVGGRFRGHVVAESPSHRGNVALARAIRAQHDRRRHARRIEVAEIMDLLPHRYPFLLVDRVVEFESGKRIVGLKNVTINEPFFRGHFPGHPIMPGVLIIEAMGQVGGLLLMDSVGDPKDKVVYFMALNNVKWRKPVTPGDQLLFEVEMVNLRRSVCKMKGRGIVDGKTVAEAEMMARIVDR
ncbi:MAG: bifunctional UDP-3-O-[3-hydroxymyristoyl] N-acetylglucosamine deacetylase/3-hydroxyacyl-ACP dehydratase [Gemmatimonadota bacterium]|nr:bifunctional UDP-3-O-[3-hydroxymyristoyl] N-acetylglucosamine deacetylase/3-hydroxyacyl-ACP dehydratase [Gemmatimonadota bacterium]MDE2985200.1 bifunctional UDP-3-O-[3-hydroxymyristoyl] N-acetylglucosamine deacetylase/3-hydroxyacyl-ACP dehydratase [Gemmatimonadota bacterium]